MRAAANVVTPEESAGPFLTFISPAKVAVDLPMPSLMASVAGSVRISELETISASPSAKVPPVIVADIEIGSVL